MESCSSLSLMKGAPAHTAKHLPIQGCPQAQIPQRVTAMSAIFNRRKLKRGKVALKAMEKVGVVGEEVEREMEEGGWWGWREMMEKCRGGCEEEGGVGMVELMECLEREAIMGEDEGKHPNDYNRRAHIFHTSSKLFQALNQTQPST